MTVSNRGNNCGKISFIYNNRILFMVEQYYMTKIVDIMDEYFINIVSLSTYRAKNDTAKQNIQHGRTDAKSGTIERFVIYLFQADTQALLQHGI